MCRSKGSLVLRRLAWAGLVPLALLAVGCNNGKEVQGEETVVATPDGVDVTETAVLSATVTAIDPDDRKVTLQMADGHKKTFKAPKDFDLGKLSVGERVKATLTEELAVSLDKGGAGTGADEASAIAVAAAAHETEFMTADALEVSARVSRVDEKKRRVTLTLADGTTKEIKVAKSIDLANVKEGDDVVARYTQAIAVELVAP
jgi:hypothetical protein